MTRSYYLTLVRMSLTFKVLLQMSYSEWPSDFFFGDFYDTYITGRPYEERYAKLRNMDPTNTTSTDLLEAERLIKRNFLTVNILAQENMLEYKDDPKLTLPAFISQLGGSLNLWAGVRRYFHAHDIFTPGWKYRYDIFTPSTVFSPPHYK